MAIQRAKAAIRRSNAPRYGDGGCNTHRSTVSAGARVAIQILYHDRKRPVTWPCVATQRSDTVRQHAHAHRDTPTTWPGTGYDTTEGRPRHGPWCATTRPAPARSVRATWAMGVCTLCT